MDHLNCIVFDDHIKWCFIVNESIKWEHFFTQFEICCIWWVHWYRRLNKTRTRRKEEVEEKKMWIYFVSNCFFQQQPFRFETLFLHFEFILFNDSNAIHIHTYTTKQLIWTCAIMMSLSYTIQCIILYSIYWKSKMIIFLV